MSGPIGNDPDAPIRQRYGVQQGKTAIYFSWPKQSARKRLFFLFLFPFFCFFGFADTCEVELLKYQVTRKPRASAFLFARRVVVDVKWTKRSN